MRITAVRIDHLEIPLRRPISTAAGDWQSRRLALIRLTSGDGAEGLGEVAAAGPGGLEGSVPARLVDDLTELDIDDTAAVQQRLEGIDAWPRIGRPIRSALESALLDLVARAGGSSVAMGMVGQPAASVRVNGLIGIDDPDIAAEDARGLVESGFGCLKLKAGGEAETDILAQVAAVRAAVGPTVELRLDLNGSLDEAAARTTLSALERYGLEYVEQPIAAASGAADLARLRREVAVPIAADEAVDGLDAAAALIAAEAVDVLVVKPARVGGLLSARRIVEAATDAEVPVVVSTLFETGVGITGALQLAASVPGTRAHGLATADVLVSDLLERSLPIRDGRLDLPTGPGLGMTLDAAAVEMYRLP